MPTFLVPSLLAAAFQLRPIPPSSATIAAAAFRIGLIRAADVSPFEGSGAAATPTSAGSELTIDNVDTVLDQVRPYLISDGGNVAVVGVDANAMTVSLQLQGACGSCPSSTVTMKMGIERVLKEQWPDLAEVVEVGSDEPSEITIDIAFEALAQIMPAITGLGGSVRIVSAETVDGRGKVVVEYTGPEKIKYGMELALRDHPLIDIVEFA